MEENKSGSGIVSKILIAVVVAAFVYGIYWLLSGGMDSAHIDGGH